MLNRKRFMVGFSEVVTFLFFLIAACILLVYVARPIDKVLHRRQIVATVTAKTVKNNLKNSKYLVFTEDEDGNVQVFEVTDVLFAGRFNSSDVYARIRTGETYRFDIGGSRLELFSWYPNIYAVNEEWGCCNKH